MNSTFSDFHLPSVDVPSLAGVTPFDPADLVDRAGTTAGRLVRRLPWVDARRSRSRYLLAVVAVVMAAAAVTVVVRRRRSSGTEGSSSNRPTDINRAA